MAKCRNCGKAIRFIITAKGRKQPIEMDSNEPHFARCGKSPEMFTREYWKPIEDIKNASMRTTNTSAKKSFYSGKKPPWDYPTFIDCWEDLLPS